ncbi:CAP domain-containing protein [Paratissierella segnis]|uniref:Serine protease n=1 Tax=Paratissierella segnis TaxID=2763679 RepID=A0A926EX35_9FIRM|nr:CAP domain-containing protein [Paratissierella segnis]MBC8587904.1 serine protease [Paratissierella segnis]
MKSKRLFCSLLVAVLFASQVSYAESFFGNISPNKINISKNSYVYSLNDLYNGSKNTYNPNKNYTNIYKNVVTIPNYNCNWGNTVIPSRPTTPNNPEVPTKPEEPTTPAEPTKPVEPTKPTEPTKPAEPTTPTAPAANLSAEEQEVVRLVNIEREKAGLKAFTASSELSRVARAKSEDMAKNNYFNHTSPTYGSPFDMMKQFGIKYSTAGENIAKGYLSAQSVVNGWMNSSGHRANILNPSFNKIGVGAYKAGSTTYWTQMFTN